MRDVFREYLEDKISWDEAYAIANNISATGSDEEEVEFYTKQMEYLGVEAAGKLMDLLGYTQDSVGVYFKPGAQDK